MTVLLDTSVLIDFLRGHAAAVKMMSELDEPALSSEVCRVEVLQGLRPSEEALAAQLFALVEWIPVVEPIATRAGALGRRWRPSHSGIGAADLIVAATRRTDRLVSIDTERQTFPDDRRAAWGVLGDGVSMRAPTGRFAGPPGGHRAAAHGGTLVPSDEIGP
ncbi:MAG: PIN domain-containing protein [Galbitalea sp.]